MANDPVLITDTRSWLLKAKEDLRTAEFEFTANPPLLTDIVFHCQQTAEKTLKGFLTWHQSPFRKTHSLEEIGEACLKQDQSLKEIVDLAVPLTEYVWKYRYPGDFIEPSQEEAREALSIARQVFEAVIARIPKETHP